MIKIMASLLTQFAVMVLIVGLFNHSSHALEKKAPGGSTVGRSTTVVAPMTKGECQGLGGVVSNWNPNGKVCPSGAYCNRADQNGVVRTSCIDEEKKQ